MLLRVLTFTALLLRATTGEDEVRFMALGDWGDWILNAQFWVADAMSEWAEVHNPHLVVSTGDNFYPWGVGSVNDRQFDTKWRDVYNHTSLRDLPWYLSIGNHDYGFDLGEEWFQVDFSNIEPRWKFPNLWYSFYAEANSFQVHFVVIDTEALRKEVNNYTAMLDWFDQELANSEGDWIIVVGHRPIFSSGDYGPVSGRNYDVIRPMLERHNVDVFLCGHDHNLQHLHKHEPGVDYIISGAGGSALYLYVAEAERRLDEEYNVTLADFRLVWGFTGFTISPSEMRIDFVDSNAETVYTYTRVSSRILITKDT